MQRSRKLSASCEKYSHFVHPVLESRKLNSHTMTEAMAIFLAILNILLPSGVRVVGIDVIFMPFLNSNFEKQSGQVT